MYFTCTIYSHENCALVGVINQKKDSSTIVWFHIRCLQRSYRFGL
jgi:hypothetical protein